MADIFTFNYKTYHHIKPSVTPNEHSDMPLRAKSVCLTERPQSKYERTVRSADPHRLHYANKQFYHRPPSADIKRQYKSVVVKQQNRKVIGKVPCAIAVQTLSIPMKYADPPERPTSKSCHKLCNKRVVTKTSNPLKQVSNNKRLCHNIGGKETENKLLLQISEAEQVTDFERILNSNAILWERTNRHVWRGSVATRTPSATPQRPRSAYSLSAVSQAYYRLFKQHEESLQSLIEQYRQASVDEQNACPPDSFLANTWYQNLHDLSEFYDDDHDLRQELETFTDQIIADEVKACEEIEKSVGNNKNFNVNLAGLIDLHVNGEGLAICDEFEPFSELEKGDENDTDEEKEWPIMNANSDDQDNTQGTRDSTVDGLAQNLNSVTIDSDAKIPTITFSNCNETCNRNDLSNNTDAVIHLGVPTIDKDETRPPMM